MTTSIEKLRKITNKLQDLIDEADEAEITKVETHPNTYGMLNFISLESDGYLNLDDIMLVEDDR